MDMDCFMMSMRRGFDVIPIHAYIDVVICALLIGYIVRNEWLRTNYTVCYYYHTIFTGKIDDCTEKSSNYGLAPTFRTNSRQQRVCGIKRPLKFQAGKSKLQKELDRCDYLFHI